MAYLVVEEGTPDGQRLFVNGLPVSRATTLRTGDRIRAGETIVKYCDDLAPIARLSEPEPEYHVERFSERRDAADPRAELARSEELIAEAPCMRRLLERVRKVAAGTSNVLILGESGAGKEVIAQAIRTNGPRAVKPFVALNAAAVPEAVLESELFGHERGAFTGAVGARRGLFELVAGGTLFLDEIGEISGAMQAKLLRILETGELRRVGANETVRVDVRVITATNRDLRAEVAARRFREDLYYRIAVVELCVPPLRERPQDLEPLVHHILARLSRDQLRPLATIDPEALALLRGHLFPGNVRELRNYLESALNFCEGGTIRAQDLPRLEVPRVAPDADFPTLAAVERAHISAALTRTRWNKSRAAALLGIDRKTLYVKIAAYGLGPELPSVSPGPSSSATSVEASSATSEDASASSRPGSKSDRSDTITSSGETDSS